MGDNSKRLLKKVAILIKEYKLDYRKPAWKSMSAICFSINGKDYIKQLNHKSTNIEDILDEYRDFVVKTMKEHYGDEKDWKKRSRM